MTTESPQRRRRTPTDEEMPYLLESLGASGGNTAAFARLMELFEHHGVTFVSVTQQFNSASSMGRFTLNIMASFAV